MVNYYGSAYMPLPGAVSISWRQPNASRVKELLHLDLKINQATN
jgi:hypothetical protein